MNVLELSEQEILRRQSLDELRRLGIDPYPAAEFPTNAFSTEIRESFSDDAEPREVCIAGRMMSCRVMGKASFVELQDSKGRIQVYVTRDDICPEENKELYNVVFKKLLDIGDFIGIRGFVFRTQTGEISVHAKELRLLSKSLKPLPIVKYKDGVAYDKFDDPELRYRQRYVDLVVNDGVKETFLQRATVIRTMRKVLDEAGYTEVETPTLQMIAGGASARPFITHFNALDQDMYMRIATELYLKRLIVGGFEGVYEIGKNFRNEGMDRNHNPEFTCMELYVQYKDYNWMMSFTEKLLETICIAVNGKPEREIDGNIVSFKAPYRRLPILDAIKEKTGFDCDGKTEEEIRAFCKEKGMEVDETMGKGKLIDELFGEFCEGTFIQPTFITGAGQRLLGAERPHRPGGTLQGADATGPEGRRRGHDHRSGLPACPAIRHAAYKRYRHRHRPTGHAHDGQDLYPGSALLPADEAGEEGTAEFCAGVGSHRRARGLGLRAAQGRLLPRSGHQGPESPGPAAEDRRHQQEI